MKKIFIVVLCLFVAVSLAGCGKNDVKNSQQDENNTVAKNQEEDKKDNSDGNYFETMTDLMTRGKSMKCTYTQDVDGGGTADGVVYMANGNSLVEMTTNVDTGHVGKMYALINQGWHYSWVDGASTGYKMTAKAAELDEKAKEKVSDLSKEIDFKCKSWRKDNSKFKVPTNVTFEDLSKIMDGFDIGEAMDEIENIDTDKMICDLCKNAPADEQAECLDGVVCDWQ